jgi:hypothetical protein
MDERNDLTNERGFCEHLLRDLHTKNELKAAIRCIIERATTAEQLDQIANGIIAGMARSDPHLFCELDDGKWTLMERVEQNPQLYCKLPNGKWTVRKDNVTPFVK